MAIQEKNVKRVFDLEGTEPLPGVPLVDVRDETGRVLHTGYYVRHINRTPGALDDYVRPDDVDHLVVIDEFSDWNLPRGIRVLKITPPHTIQMHEGPAFMYEEEADE